MRYPSDAPMEGGLFDPANRPNRPALSTSTLAGQVAAGSMPSRRERILRHLADRPMALWEVATLMEVHDHQISGRFTDLVRDGLIERTGDRRQKPETGCWAEVYRVVEGQR